MPTICNHQWIEFNETVKFGHLGFGDKFYVCLNCGDKRVITEKGNLVLFDIETGELSGHPVDFYELSDDATDKAKKEYANSLRLRNEYLDILKKKLT